MVAFCPMRGTKACSCLVDDRDLKNKLIGLLALAKQATSFCRDWRNRRFAHYDLALATDNKATPLADRFPEFLFLQSADGMNAPRQHGQLRAMPLER